MSDEVIPVKDPQKGDMVRYVMKMDFDPTDTIPNICPALVTKARPAVDGKPASISVHVFTPSGGFVDAYVEEDQGGSRGTWHWK